MSKVYTPELEDLKTYIFSEKNEDAKRKYAYPLFRKKFGEKFKTESECSGADGYVEGTLLIELKSDYEDWLEGFYQALHYEKLGLGFPAICVISYKFLGLWKIKDIPDFALELAKESNPLLPPNSIGKINANKTNKAQALKILRSNHFLLTKNELEGFFERSPLQALFEFLNVIKHLEKERIPNTNYQFY